MVPLLTSAASAPWRPSHARRRQSFSFSDSRDTEVRRVHTAADAGNVTQGHHGPCGVPTATSLRRGRPLTFARGGQGPFKGGWEGLEGEGGWEGLEGEGGWEGLEGEGGWEGLEGEGGGGGSPPSPPKWC